MTERFTKPYDEVIGPDGHVAAPVDLDEILAAFDAELTTEPDLSSAVAVHTHGELGPVLTAPGEHFTGEHDLHS